MSQKKPQNKKKKPLRRAERWMAAVPGMAGRLVVVLIATIVLGLMFSALQTLGSVPIRIVLSALIASGMLFMHYSDGLTRGTLDAGSSCNYDRAKEKGHTLSQKDDAACYHPMKAIAAALLVYGVFIVLGVMTALSARDYTYALQDLPVWLTDSYGARADVFGPLSAYAADVPVAGADWVRMLARLPELMFLNLFPDVQRMSGMIDRLTPLMLLIFPAAYVAGYMRGPANNDKRELMQKRAKKVAVRRAQKSSLAEELVKSGADVHYGHANTQKEHKRKELV